ncbi:MAG: capsular biosynthesis protein [Salinisphaeraceae bacterium]|nr:capsular biosynthesis protein [Salinisphaeraceae bacterium]
MAAYSDDDAMDFNDAFVPGVGGFTPRQFLALLISRWRFVAIAVAIMLIVALLATLLQERRFEASAAILLDFRSEDPVTGQNFPAYLADSYVSTQLDLLRSRKVRLEVVDALGMADDEKARAAFESRDSDAQDSFRVWLADNLGKSLSVQEGSESRIIDVTYESNDPEQAAAVANAVVRAYRDAALGLSVDSAQQRQSRYSAYLDQLKADVDEAQENLTAAQQEFGLINVEGEGTSDSRRLDDLEMRLNAAQTEREAAQAEVRRIQELRSGGRSLSAQADILNSNYVQELKGRLVQLESRFADMSESLGPNHPQIQSVRAEISTVRSRLNSEISSYIQSQEGEARSAAEREAAVKNRIEQEKGDVLDVKRQRDDIAKYVRDLSSAKELYQSALDRYDQILGGSELQQTNMTVVSWAQPPREPFSPNPKLSMIVGLFAGLFFGCLAALIAELLDRRIRTTDDVTHELNLPLLMELRA